MGSTGTILLGRARAVVNSSELCSPPLIGRSFCRRIRMLAKLMDILVDDSVVKVKTC